MYVCGYRHCLHIGKKRYHEDCLKTSETIKLIKDTYLEKMNSEENPVTILSVINTLVFKKGMDVEYILFCLEEMCNKEVKFKAPYTMHYFDKNLIMKEKWRKLNANR